MSSEWWLVDSVDVGLSREYFRYEELREAMYRGNAVDQDIV